MVLLHWAGDMTNSELRKSYLDRYRVFEASWQNFLSEARRDTEFALLAQNTETEWEKAQRQGRELFVFDRTRRQLDLLEGYEQRNRHILKIGPAEQQDDYACMQHTILIMQIMNGAKGYTGYDCMSSAFKWGSLASGSNLLEIWKDRQGDLRLFRRPFNSFLLDPMMTQPDLSDCNDILTGQWMLRDKVKILLPAEASAIKNVPSIKHSVRWPFMGSPLFHTETDIDLYEEWWRRKTDFTDTVVHRPSGDEIAFKQLAEKFGDRKAASDWIKAQGDILARYDKPRKRILLTIYVNGEPVWDGANPLGVSDYNFIWMHGEWVPEIGRSELKLQPFVRCLRDPQRAYNRKMNQAFDIVESQIQTGKIIRDEHLVNPKDAYRSGQAVNLHVKDGADDVPLQEILRNIDSVDIKPGLFHLLEHLDSVMTTSGGLNEEIFGTDDKENMPALLNKYRTGAALTGKQGIFSGYRAAKRELGVKLVRIIQKNFSEYKVKRILGEYPVNTFYVPDLVKYDCVPTEGLLTDNQKEMNFQQWIGLRQLFPDLAQSIPLSLLVKMSPIQPTKEIMAAVKANEQRQQQEAQLQLENQKRINALVEAQAQADLARSKEDISDIQENRANIALKNAQTLVEIQKLKGETARAPSNEMFEKLLEITDRVLESKKIDKKAG